MGAALLALFIAAVFRVLLGSKAQGTENMESIGAEVRRGANTFLRREVVVVALMTCCTAVILYLFIDTGWRGVQTGGWQKPYAFCSFLGGVFFALLAEFIGISASTLANVRTAQAARTSLGRGLHAAILGGGIVGLAAVGFGLLGVTGTFFFLLEFESVGLSQALQILVAFAAGASTVAMFTRVAGGVLVASTAIIADRTAADAHAGAAERTTARILHCVGAHVTGVCGMGGDLLESFLLTVVAAMLLGVTADIGATGSDVAVLYPLFIAGLGITASVIAPFIVRSKKGSDHVQGPLRNGMLAASCLMMVGAFFLGRQFLPADQSLPVFIALAAGVLLGILVSVAAEYPVSPDFSPVFGKAGSASVLLGRLSAGFFFAFLPVLFLAGAFGVAFFHAGLYGVAIASLGMLSTFSVVLAVHAFGPIVDTADSIAQHAELPKQVRARTDALCIAAHTSSIFCSIYATVAAGLTALACFAAFTAATAIPVMNLLDRSVLVGLLLGAALPFLCSGILLKSVGRGVASFAFEIWRMRQGIPPDTLQSVFKDSSCVRVVSRDAFRAVMFPGIIATLLPIAAGVLLGAAALGGLLLGGLASGIPLALFFSVSSGTFGSARKCVESGNVCGPGVLSVLKLMSVVALLTAGLFPMQGILF